MKKLLLILSGLVLTFSPLSVVRAGPLQFQIYPDSYFQTRQVEVFISGTRLNPGTATTILARVYGDSTRTMINGERLRLQIEGGEGTVARAVADSYSATNSASIVEMDHICYNKVGSLIQDNFLVRDSSSFAAVTIANYGVPCESGYVDSGWYMAKIFAPTKIERDQTQHLRITDLSDPNSNRATTSISTVAANSFVGALDQTQMLPMVHEANFNKDVPTIIFAQDRRGFGLSCAPGNGSGESNSDSGCNIGRNGYVVPEEQSVDMNQSFPFAPHAGALLVDPSSITNAKIYSRGNSTTTLNGRWALTNLGGGAYLMIMRAGTHLDRAEVMVEAYDSDGVPLTFGLLQINVTPLVFRVTTLGY